MALTSIAPQRDKRVVAYLLLAVGAASVAILAGDAWPATIAAVAVAQVIVGLRSAGPLPIAPTVEVPVRRVIEGDPVRATITIDHPSHCAIDVMLASPANPLGEPEYIEHRESASRTTVVVERATNQWGNHQIGDVIVRATEAGSMLVWEQNVGAIGSVRVLPTPARLNEMLSPRASQAAAGAHAAPLTAGDGVEFVDIREYRPGDRVRDINWKVTARRGEPHINRRRPDRAGDVIILIDALPDSGWETSNLGAAMLHQAGQATWALIKNHLASQDRVGLIVSRSQGIRNVPAAGGARAQYVVLDALLDANATHIEEPLTQLDLSHIPVGTLALNVTTLASDHALMTAAALGANGRNCGVLAISSGRLLDRNIDVAPATARLSRLTFDARVAFLRRVGVPVAVWHPGQDLGRAVSRLSEMTRRSRRGVA